MQSPTNPGFRERALRLIRGILEYDRRSWNRLLRQMEDQDRWVCRSVRGLFQHRS